MPKPRRRPKSQWEKGPVWPASGSPFKNARRNAVSNPKKLSPGTKVSVWYQGEKMDAVVMYHRDGLVWVRLHGGHGRAVGYKRRDIQAANRNPAKRNYDHRTGSFSDLNKQGFMKRIYAVQKKEAKQAIPIGWDDNGRAIYAKKKAKRNPAVKRNPEASARAAYRDFHGKDPETVITVDTPRHYHGVLPGIGKLDFVSLYRPQGRAKGIKFSKGTYLCENEKRTQLFIVGGDQSVNLKDFGISHPHETEVLGEVSEIGYRTEKLHLIEKDGGKGLYVHKFSVPRPTLVYDVRNKLLSFAGGGYTIPSEGIDG